jgi:hypothetical protein
MRVVHVAILRLVSRFARGRAPVRGAQIATQNVGVSAQVAATERRFRCTWLRPVRAWRVWLEASGITEGAAFRPVSRHDHVGAT